jgi:hypothetical protein
MKKRQQVRRSNLIRVTGMRCMPGGALQSMECTAVRLPSSCSAWGSAGHGDAPMQMQVSYPVQRFICTPVSHAQQVSVDVAAAAATEPEAC